MFNRYIFDVSSNFRDSKIIILPVPFDATSSYRKTSRLAPHSMLDASIQVDLFDIDFGNIYRKQIYMEKISKYIFYINKYISKIYKKLSVTTKNYIYLNSIKKINALMNLNNKFIYKWTKLILNYNKLPIIIGGEHSVILGSIKACFDHYQHRHITILHIDAHSDMHKQYHNFINSHASIAYNIIKTSNKCRSLIQIGVRDISYNEYKKTCLEKNVFMLPDKDIRKYRLSGANDIILNKILIMSNKLLYITIDIDGLDISLCPNTGTPVPGGLSFDYIIALLKNIKKYNRKIIGFDICETSNSSLDSIVSIRLLYKLLGSI